jgi:hypothetical protein
LCWSWKVPIELQSSHHWHHHRGIAWPPPLAFDLGAPPARDPARICTPWRQPALLWKGPGQDSSTEEAGECRQRLEARQAGSWTGEGTCLVGRSGQPPVGCGSFGRLLCVLRPQAQPLVAPLPITRCHAPAYRRSARRGAGRGNARFRILPGDCTRLIRTGDAEPDSLPRLIQGPVWVGVPCNAPATPGLPAASWSPGQFEP